MSAEEQELDADGLLRSTATHWDGRFQSEASVSQREAQYALAASLYQQLNVNPYFASDGTDWVEWVRRKVSSNGPLGTALVLGCGLGDGLLDFHRRGIAKRLHGIDLSATAIEVARKGAAERGLQDVVTFEVGDFHDCALESGAFDVVFMVMSLHHALDLDVVLGRIRGALRPGGFFVANEYVGPDRWQHTWTQLVAIKALLTVLPRAKRRRLDGSTKGRIGRPTLAWMMKTDPSEAAHSADIPERVSHWFADVERIDYGGGVAVPVLDEIIANFRAGSRSDMALLRGIVAVDRLLWRCRMVPSANAVLLARRGDR